MYLPRNGGQMMATVISPERLKQLRKARGLTQRQLGQRAQPRLNEQTIYRFERHAQTVRQGTIERIARALNVEPQVLTGEKPIPPDAVQQSGINEGGAYQLNVRVNAAIRNAFSLVALRYKIAASRIVEVAPLLFAIAAEGSLKRRGDKLNELEAAFDGAAGLRQNFPHLPFWIAETFENSEPLAAEKRSIQDRDLFGEAIPDDVFTLYDNSREYDENSENPFVTHLHELAAAHDDISISEIGPGATEYTVGEALAAELTGGDERLARGILNGWVLIHEIPRELLKKDAVQERVEWLRPRIEDAYNRNRAFLEELGL
jgi:transcriptional regulator with XRE-family HTH domain